MIRFTPLLLFLGLQYFFSICHAQNKESLPQVNVSLSKINELYIGIDNPISIVAECTACSSLYVTIQDQTLIGKNCHYTITPTERQSIHLNIFEITATDTILLLKKQYQTAPLPLPTAKIGGIKTGKIQLAKLKAQGGVQVNNTYYYLIGCKNIPLVHYRIIVLRNHELVGVVDNKGNRFEPPVLALLQKIEVGDQVYITDIVAKYPTTEWVQLNTITLEVE